MTWAEASIELKAVFKQIDKSFAEKDAEIHQLKQDLADAVQNIHAHSMIVDASEKDAEIERLREQLDLKDQILKSVAQQGIEQSDELELVYGDLKLAQSEIERLKLELNQEKQYAADLTTTLRCEAEDKDTLITDLVDWIHQWRQVDEICATKLLQRAREEHDER